MIQSTSIEAYHEIKENGLLSHRRFEVYEELCLGGPGTQTEVIHRMWKKGKGQARGSAHSYTPRFAELKEHGVIVEGHERKCSVTGMTCIEWVATGSLPVKRNRKLRREFWIGVDCYGRLNVFKSEKDARSFYFGEGSLFGDTEIEIIPVVEKL